MDPDLTKLQSITLDQAFKNNNVYEGSFNISGTVPGISKTISQDIILPDGFDTFDIMFKGRADGGFGIPTDDPRPNAAYFKQGSVWVRSDDSGAGYTNYPLPFALSARITNNVLTIDATTFKQFIANLTLTSEPVYYKIVDYSVF